MRLMLRFLLSTMLIFSLTSSLTENFFAAEHCVAEAQVSHEEAQSDLNQMQVGRSTGHPKELTDLEDHDCSCPVHGSGCVHSSAGAIAAGDKWFDYLSQTEASRLVFSDRDQANQKGPYIEAPFQPPRV